MKSSGGISMTEKVCPKCGCKSYYDMRPQVAWCWASGLIEIGDAAPPDSPDGSGAILIASGPKSHLHYAMTALARRAISAGCYLVPGVPESENKSQAFYALTKWLSWCARGNRKKHMRGVEFRSIDVN